MPNTLGIHWIATTYGTWLHGDPHGSWHKGRLVGPDPFHENAVRDRMTHDAVVLTPDELVCVASVVGQTITEHRHRVYAATIQPTHLHAVFAPLPEDIATTIARLKKRTANRVLQGRRIRSDHRKHLWTQGRFSVFIFDEDHLHNTIAYVRRHNTQIGKAPDPYDWVTPVC